tara:strand:- start:5390 stop:6331 length:942 start_codon:yes stop_codon:yes gene_type:complete
MAIFRAGKRIGNMDIRVGLPRDRTLDNVEGDKRLRRQPGTNPQTSIGRFVSEINRGEGIARANRFLIRLYPPKQVYSTDFDKVDTLQSNDMIKNVELMCTSVALPHRDVLTENFVTYGPGRKMPYAYGYGSKIECMFMGDKFLRQRAFFETWQGKMHSLDTHNLQYYDNYIGSMEIYQLGQYRETDQDTGYSDNYRLTYGVRLHEVYPETIGEIQYQSLTDDPMPMDIPISFAFRTWENITLDALNNVKFGQGVPDMPNIKPAKNYGIFGGILGKMPPEIKRASKQVIEKIRRDIPIGKSTGGRVYPPFVINK